MEHFLACRQNAFEYFGGAPRRLTIDNLKTAVLSHPAGQPAIYHPHYLDFARFFGVELRACNVRAAHEKGIVENAVGYVKQNFLRGYTPTSLAEANCAEDYYRQMETRRPNPRQHARKIVALSEIYGVEEVDRALRDALEFEAFSSEYIANILERRRRVLPEPGALHLTRRQDLLDSGFTPNGPGSIRKPKQGDPMKTAVELDTFLKELQLVWIRQQYEALAAEAAQHHWSHADYLRRLLEGECLRRRENRIQRRIQSARFPVVKTLDSFNWSWPKKNRSGTNPEPIPTRLPQGSRQCDPAGGCQIGQDPLSRSCPAHNNRMDTYGEKPRRLFLGGHVLAKKTFESARVLVYSNGVSTNTKYS